MAPRYRWLVCLSTLLATVPAVVAGNIDVTGKTSTLLNSGDVLFYTVADWNFVKDAQGLGVSQYPNAVTFQLLTAPLTGPTQFKVDLVSNDGTTSVDFPGLLSFAAGTLQSSLYNGPVSALSGTFNLSASQSRQMFAGSSAVLAVCDAGAGVTLGLAPYTLGQDLFVTLSGSNFSVGAPQGDVVLDPPQLDPVATPEPVSVWLLLSGAALLMAIPAALRRPA